MLLQNSIKRKELKVTQLDFRHALTEDEHKSFKGFLSRKMKPSGSIMKTIPSKNKRYSTMLSSINTYDKDELIETALERINAPKTTPSMRRTLSKVVEVARRTL